MRMVHEWVVRPDYGRIRPWVHRERRGDRELIVAIAGPDKLVLRGPRLPLAVDGSHRDEFVVNEGDVLTFSTTWIPSHLPVPRLLEFDGRIQETIEEQQAWADECSYDGPWRTEVVRSLVTLRGLTHAETGGIVAAPTTSLPEDFGGERNWDYRYCWLRDASLTLDALLAAGRSEVAKLWRGWLLRAVAGDSEDLQIMYTVDGGRHLPERELDHLAGYEGSRPVRIGNGAVEQRQTDVLGEVMHALHRGPRRRPQGDRRQLVPAAHAGQPARRHLGPAGQRALGDPRPVAQVHPQPGDGLGRLRPRRTRRRGARARGAGRPLARAARRGARRGHGPGVRRGAQHVHAALRHPRGRRVAAGAPPGRLRGRQRPADARHDRGGGAGPAAQRAAAALPHGDRGGRAVRRRVPLRGLLVLAGLGLRARRTDRGRPPADAAPGRAGQRRRAAQRGVRRGARPDGRQLPAGVLAPGARRRGDGAARRGGGGRG